MFGHRFIFRVLSTFKPANTLFSSEYAIGYLKNPNNYVDSNLDLIQTSLEVLNRDVQQDMLDFDEYSDPLSVFSKEFRVLINKTNPIQASTILTCIKSLGISNSKLWNNFQDHIRLNFTSMNHHELGEIVQACSINQMNDQLLWSMLEETAVKLLESDTEFSDSSIYKILNAFSKSKNESLQRNINQKIIKSVELFDPKYFTSITKVLTSKRLQNPEIFNAFIMNFDEIKSSLTGNTVATVLCCFMKNKASSPLIDDLEDIFMKNVNLMSLPSMAHVAESYCLALGTTINVYKRKVHMMKSILKNLEDEKDRLYSQLSEDLSIMYAMRILDAIDDMDIPISLKLDSIISHEVTIMDLKDSGQYEIGMENINLDDS